MKNLSYYTLLVGTILGIIGISSPGLAFPGQTPTIEPFTFAQVCDPQLGMPGPGYEQSVASFRQAVRRVNALRPDFVVMCGDYIHTAGNMNLWNDESITDFKQIKDGLAVSSYCAPGNNDVGNVPTVASLNRYREAIGKDYYSAEDMQPSLRESSKGLYIGAGKSLSPGSFWFGLIDDVRIYDRVVAP